jgi:flagellar motility protein MotE (MotC chaperone)
MMKFVRDLRLIPIALIASACLLALKTADIVLDSPYLFAANRTGGRTDDSDVSLIRRGQGDMLAEGKPDSWAKQMFNFPDGSKTQGQNPSQQSLPKIASRQPGRTGRGNDVTGSVPEPPPAAPAKADPKAGAKTDGKTDAKTDANAKPAAAPANPPSAGQTIVPTEGPIPTGAERAILQRLQQRREELDSRARELEMRESLIQSAEKRIDTHLGELKDIETQIKVETEQKNQGADARLKALITMYESMKPRDAAKIFNGLEDSVLVEVASKINPRTMAEIMAQMQADVAQRLTVELAAKAQPAAQPGAGPADLPKINGQPTAAAR